MPRSTAVQAGALAVLAAATAVSYVGAEHVVDLTLHHVGTVVGLAALLWTMRRAPITDAAFLGVSGFLMLHIVGAHWLYSFVPYDRWSEALFGVSVSETFGWRRNHFDRLIHVAFGLLVTGAFRELIHARTRASPGAARFFALMISLAGSSLYEMAEWGVSLTASPESVENYNGQQGDAFDPQKDTALAALGAVISTVWDVVRRR